MAIFSYKLRYGRTTQTSSHAFTEDAEPPTPPATANPIFNNDKAKLHLLPAHRIVTGTSKRRPNTAPETNSSTDTNPIATPTKNREASIARPSPNSRGRASSVKGSYVVAIPSIIPPPDRPLPPTPDSLPDGKISTKGYATDNESKQSAPIISPINNLSTPPSSFSLSNKLCVAIGGPAGITSSSRETKTRSRSSSASSVVPTTPINIVKSSLDSNYPLINQLPLTSFPSSTSKASATSATQNVQRYDTFGANQFKNRPTALKLKTSNLDLGNKATSKVRVEGLPSLDQDNTSKDEELFLIDKENVKLSAHSSGHAQKSEYSINDKSDEMEILRPSITIRQASDETIRQPSQRAEKRRSLSTSDALSENKLKELRNINKTTHHSYRPFTQPLSHPTSPSNQPKLHPVITPASATETFGVITPGSAYTLQPTSNSAGLNQVKLFDNIPTPWSTKSVSEITAELGEDEFNHLVEETTVQLKTSSSKPRFLHPDHIKSSAVEENRLKPELNRLKEKHLILIEQRETILKKLQNNIVKLDHNNLLKIIQALGQCTKKVDRVSRQIYICNDQIKQMQLESKEHLVGCLRVALEKQERELEDIRQEGNASIPSQAVDTNNTKKDLGIEPIQIQVTEQAIDEVEVVPTEHQVNRRNTIIRFVEPETPSAKSPLKSRGSMRISFCPTALSTTSFNSNRPLSTATVININSLSFPIPPDRIPADNVELDIPLTSQSTENQLHESNINDSSCSDGGLQVRIMGESESKDSYNLDIESTDSHTTSASFGNSDQYHGYGSSILIYPPDHDNSNPTPILGLEIPKGVHKTGNGCSGEYLESRLSTQNEDPGKSEELLSGNGVSRSSSITFKIPPKRVKSQSLLLKRNNSRNRKNPNSLTIQVY
ncbi:uncharacterized protein L201_005611 [Kwoniella dendrophila CBS 6074]|uniref:Up-regulated during septation protein 1 domain-containing protein n=1 Tax=Kwoniella dendrophila CBS 6074 TaxID=1295534 RepID=A0AAX4K1G2_9TREE